MAYKTITLDPNTRITFTIKLPSGQLYKHVISGGSFGIEASELDKPSDSTDNATLVDVLIETAK